MKSINEITLLGHAGKDGEVRHFTSSSKGSVSIATSRSWKQDDEWVSDTTWHLVEGWSRIADEIGLIKKGDPVLVIGRLVKEKYEKDGQQMQIVKVLANTVQVVVKRDHESGQQSGGQSRQAPANAQPIKEPVKDNPTDFQSDNHFDDIPW